MNAISSIGGCLTPLRNKKEKEQKQDAQIESLEANHEERKAKVDLMINKLQLGLKEVKAESKNAVDLAQKYNENLHSITTTIKEEVKVIKVSYDEGKEERKEVQSQLIQLEYRLGQLEKSAKENEEKTELSFEDHKKRMKSLVRIVNKKDEAIEQLTQDKLHAHACIEQLAQDKLDTQACLDEFERKLGQLTKKVLEDKALVRHVNVKFTRWEAMEAISNKAAKEKAKLTVLRLIEKELGRSVEDNLLNDIKEIINIAESIEERKEYLDSDKCEKWKSICNRKEGWLGRIIKVWSSRDKNLEDVGNEMAALSEDSMGGSQPIHLKDKYKDLYHIIDIIGLVKSDDSNTDSGVSNYILEIIEEYKNRRGVEERGVEESKREDDSDGSMFPYRIGMI